MQEGLGLPAQFFSSLIIDSNILGQGHDAKVLLVKDPRDGKQYALKCQAQKIQDTAINLFNEIQILIHMKHPNIIKLIGHSQDYTCLVLEYCQNGTLAQLIKKSPLQVNIAAAILYKVTEVLNFMHNQGFTHGDLKLSNILIDNEYNLKFCDFGFSRWNGKMAIEKRTIAGSEGYTAPEIWKPEPNYQKADVFSLAVIFFILITGHPPFESNNPDNNDPWWKLISNNQWEIYWKDIRTAIDDDCKKLFVQMFSTKPEDRYDTSQLIQWFGTKKANDKQYLKEIKHRLENN